MIQAYREIGRDAGHVEKDLKVGAHSWGWIAEDGEQAVKDYFHPTKQVVDAISKDRPHWQELRYEQYLGASWAKWCYVCGQSRSGGRKN